MEFQSNQLDDEAVPEPDISDSLIADIRLFVRRYYPYLCFWGSVALIIALGFLGWHQNQHTDGNVPY